MAKAARILVNVIGAQGRMVAVMRMLLLTGIAVLSMCLLSLGPVMAQEIENLARGGDFEDGTDRAEWNLNLGNAGVGQLEIDKKEAAIGEASLFVSGINFDPAENWKPQIDQGNIDILEDGVYTISAFLKAEEPREVGMYAELQVDPWTKSPSGTAKVHTEWEEFWATGMPAAAAVGIGFSNRGSKVNYWIDGVRFYAGEYVPTEVDGIQRAVKPGSKLTTTWGRIRKVY